jgi:vacuolar protein sorting-associated protein 33A
MLEGDSHLDDIEELFCSDTGRTQLLRGLRLLCLQSLTAGGIRAARLDAVRRVIAQTYGYHHLFTLANLEKVGMIKRKEALIVELTSPWANLRKQLK